MSASRANPALGRALHSRSRRGSVSVEYSVILALVGLVVALALVSVGPSTVQNYARQRMSLYQTSP